MTKTALQQAILFEGRSLPSSTTMASWVLDIIDEILLEFCQQSRYQELYSPDNNLTLTAGVGYVSLPTDYHHLKEVRYDINSTGTFATLQKTNQFSNKLNVSGHPTFYFLSGGKLYFWPYSSVTTSDTLQIDYYKKPSFGVNDAFPIPSLEAAVKRACVARLLRYNNDAPNAATAAKDATFGFSTSHNG